MLVHRISYDGNGNTIPASIQYGSHVLVVACLVLNCSTGKFVAVTCLKYQRGKKLVVVVLLLLL